MPIYLGNNRLTSTGGSGGGGSLTNTYAAFHVNPAGPVTTVNAVRSSANISTITPQAGVLRGISIGFFDVLGSGASSVLVFNAMNGEFIDRGSVINNGNGTGQLTTVNVDIQTGEYVIAQEYRANPGTDPDPVVTEGYDITTGVYTHPEGGAYLETGVRVRQGSTYPNATVTGSESRLQNVSSFNEVTAANSGVRVVFDGTTYWQFVWSSNPQRTLRNDVNFNLGTDASLIATPYTASGSGNNITYTAGTPVTIVEAISTATSGNPNVLNNPRGLNSNIAGFRIIDVAWNDSNSEFVFIVQWNVERGGLNLDSTIRLQTLADLTTGTAQNFSHAIANSSGNGGFNWNGHDASITVDPRNGNYLISINNGNSGTGTYLTNVRSLGTSATTVFVDAQGLSNAAIIEWAIVGNRVYNIDSQDSTTLNIGNADLPETPNTTTATAALRDQSSTTLFTIPGTTSNASSFSLGRKLLADGNELIVPLGGSTDYLNISNVTDQMVLDGLIVDEPLVGDITVRTVSDSGLSGQLDQTVFLKIN